jgi:hypothetical protein
LWLNESGTYVKLTPAGVELFARSTNQSRIRLSPVVLLNTNYIVMIIAARASKIPTPTTIMKRNNLPIAYNAAQPIEFSQTVPTLILLFIDLIRAT